MPMFGDWWVRSMLSMPTGLFGGVLPTRRDCGLSGMSIITFSSGSFLGGVVGVITVLHESMDLKDVGDSSELDET